MKIVNIDIERITPYELNPRLNDDAVASVAASIKEFGFQQPLVLDKQNVIIVGHTRLKAARALKMKTVPCLVAAELTETQAKAYRIMDNAAAEGSSWEMDLLTSELGEIEHEFPPEFFGLEFQEIERATLKDEPWDFSTVEDFSLITIRAPLLMQSEIRKRLEGLDGIEIQATHIF